VGVNQIIEFNGKLYQLVRAIKVSQVGNNMEGLKAWRDFLHCDHVLKHNELYLMVRFVDDIEWEEINEESN
jgi:hypothetical protein